MIVLDASAGLEMLLASSPAAPRVWDRLDQPGVTVHVPHVFDLEIVNALRRRLRAGDVSHAEAALALKNLTDMRVTRHAHWPLQTAIWRLRDALTAYDAVYVALAKSLNAPIITLDAGVARAAFAQGVAVDGL